MLAEKLFQTDELADIFKDQASVTATKSNDTVAQLINKQFFIDDVEKKPDSTSGPDITSSSSEATLPINEARIVRDAVHEPARKEKELQWWLGTILEVKGNSFSANLEDLDGRVNIVEFDIAIIPQKQLNRLKVDSKFTYSVRSRESYAGGLEYLTKLNIYAKRNWHTKYEEHVQAVIDNILPDDLLDL